MTRLSGPASAVCRLTTGRATHEGAVVLCYHDVVAGPDVDLDLNVTATQLRRQLELCRRLGFRFVPLAELTRLAVAGVSVTGLVAVTFDDALAGVARHGVPILLELDVPATLFTVSTQWGRRPRWWAGSGPTMSRAELLECRDHGLTIAAHTRTHASLPTLSGVGQGTALREEVAGSRAELEDLVQEQIEVFAYPFGHHDPVVRECVREAGFTGAYTFLNGRLSSDDDPLRLPRFTMGRHHGRTRLAYHLARSAASWPDHQEERVTGSDRI